MKANARMVVEGDGQVEGIYYLEVFIPTPATASVRMITTFACEYNFDTYHLDAEQEFIQSELGEGIS